MINNMKFTAYLNTDVSPKDSKLAVNKLLRNYGVKKVAWRWNPPKYAVVMFPIQNIVVKIPTSEKMTFTQGMRAIYWHLKSWLEELVDYPAEEVFMRFTVLDKGDGTLSTIAQSELPRFRRYMLEPNNFPQLTSRGE